MDLKGLFVGYKNFYSKKYNKSFYIIQVLITSEENNSYLSILKNLYVSEEEFNTISNSLNLFDNITLSQNINIINDKVYYKINF